MGHISCSSTCCRCPLETSNCVSIPCPSPLPGKPLTCVSCLYLPYTWLGLLKMLLNLLRQKEWYSQGTQQTLVTFVSAPYLIHLILYGDNCFSVFSPYFMTITFDTMFSPLSLSMMTSYTFWLTIQRVRKMLCLWVLFLLWCQQPPPRFIYCLSPRTLV